MLPGDAEEEEQRATIDRFGAAALRAQVLKVAHHGSAYQEPAFLDAVDPVVALVSVGVGNGYGHPNPALLARLSRDGARVLRTDLAGDLAVVRRGGGLAVVASGGPAAASDPVYGMIERIRHSSCRTVICRDLRLMSDRQLIWVRTFGPSEARASMAR